MRQALLLIANIARWAALSVGVARTSDAGAAPGRRIADDDRRYADTLVDVFEMVQDVRLRHQPEHLEAGETPSDTMRLRAMSAIEASVLDEAIREILAIQRRIANRAK